MGTKVYIVHGEDEEGCAILGVFDRPPEVQDVKECREDFDTFTDLYVEVWWISTRILGTGLYERYELTETP